MFGIGWTEFIVIALVLLIFVGPRHLPMVFRKVGMVMSELKNASRELRNQVAEEVRDIERTIGGSPKKILRDLELDITDESSPYAEARRTETEIREEIVSIKASLEGETADAPSNRLTGDDTSSDGSDGSDGSDDADDVVEMKKDG